MMKVNILIKLFALSYSRFNTVLLCCSLFNHFIEGVFESMTHPESLHFLIVARDPTRSILIHRHPSVGVTALKGSLLHFFSVALQHDYHLLTAIFKPFLAKVFGNNLLVVTDERNPLHLNIFIAAPILNHLLYFIITSPTLDKDLLL